MAGTLCYWLDSNVFIQAKNGPYKTFGVFWAFLHEQINAGVIRYPKMVYQEIVTNEERDDDLAKWMKTRRRSGLFAEPAADVQEAMQTVADYVMENYVQQHAAEFLGEPTCGSSRTLSKRRESLSVTSPIGIHTRRRSVSLMCTPAVGVPCIEPTKCWIGVGQTSRLPGKRKTNRFTLTATIFRQRFRQMGGREYSSGLFGV
jgi:hypothetical protein